MSSPSSDRLPLPRFLRGDRCRPTPAASALRMTQRDGSRHLGNGTTSLPRLFGAHQVAQALRYPVDRHGVVPVGDLQEAIELRQSAFPVLLALEGAHVDVVDAVLRQ